MHANRAPNLLLRFRQCVVAAKPARNHAPGPAAINWNRRSDWPVRASAGPTGISPRRGDLPEGSIAIRRIAVQPAPAMQVTGPPPHPVGSPGRCRRQPRHINPGKRHYRWESHGAGADSDHSRSDARMAMAHSGMAMLVPNRARALAASGRQPASPAAFTVVASRRTGRWEPAARSWRGRCRGTMRCRIPGFLDHAISIYARPALSGIEHTWARPSSGVIAGTR